MDTRYLFIDGGYFRKVLEKMGQDFFAGDNLAVDYQRLTSSFDKVFYYDCYPPKLAKELEVDYKARIRPQEAQFHSLRAHDGWHVVEGVMVGEGSRARQKQVDVRIAVDMLTHSYRRNMQRIAFIAGDQDFKPLVDAVVREGMYIELWYEASSASQALVEAADARRPLGPYQIHNFLISQLQLKHPLPSRTGTPDSKPKDASLLEEGTGKFGKARLYKHMNQYSIAIDDPLNLGRYRHTSHADLEYLKKVFDEVEGTTEWSSSFG